MRIRLRRAAILLAFAASAGACKVGVLLGEESTDAAADGMAADSAAPDADGRDAIVAADVVDGGFDVGSVPGLALWLDGDRGLSPVAGGGLTWLDQSGRGNHATTPSGAPGVTTTGFAGHSALRFDGSNVLRIADSATTRFSADYTVIVVAASREPAADYGALYNKQLQPNPYTGPAMFVNYAPLDGTRHTTVGNQVDFYHWIESPEQNTNDGTARIFEMKRAGTLLSSRVNGNAPALLTVPVTDVTSAGIDTFIGGHVPTGVRLVQAFVGDIAEVIAVNGPISPSDYQSVHDYLSAKHGIF